MSNLLNNTEEEEIKSLKVVILSLLFLFLIKLFVFAPSIVKGESMQPTLQNNDIVVVNKVSPINRFDIVVFHSEELDEYLIKRVIGVPGDKVSSVNDTLYINEHSIEEPYLVKTLNNGTIDFYTENFSLQELTGSIKVPKGCYFVLGDNRQNSTDSRYLGFISKEDIVGEVDLRVFPSMRLLHN